MRLGLYHHGDPEWFYGLPVEQQRDIWAILIHERGDKPGQAAPTRPARAQNGIIRTPLTPEQNMARVRGQWAKGGASAEAIRFWGGG